MLTREFLCLFTGITVPNCTTTITIPYSGPSGTGLDITCLWKIVQGYYQHGTVASTNNTYAADQHRYEKFCSSIHKQPLPTIESILLLFVSYLATSGLSCSTIKVYLSAVGHLHVTKGKHKEFLD